MEHFCEELLSVSAEQGSFTFCFSVEGPKQ